MVKSGEAIWTKQKSTMRPSKLICQMSGTNWKGCLKMFRKHSKKLAKKSKCLPEAFKAWQEITEHIPITWRRSRTSSIRWRRMFKNSRLNCRKLMKNWPELRTRLMILESHLATTHLCRISRSRSRKLRTTLDQLISELELFRTHSFNSNSKRDKNRSRTENQSIFSTTSMS